jgi:hypothetical protein
MFGNHDGASNSLGSCSALQALYHILQLVSSDGSFVEIVVYQDSSACTGSLGTQTYTYDVSYAYVKTDGSVVNGVYNALLNQVPDGHKLDLKIWNAGASTLDLTVQDLSSGSPITQTFGDSKILTSKGVTLTAKIKFYNDIYALLPFVSFGAASSREQQWDWAGLTNDNPPGIVDMSVCSNVYGRSDSYSQAADYCDYTRSGSVTIVDIGLQQVYYGITWPTGPYPGQGQPNYTTDSKWGSLCFLLTGADAAFCNHMFHGGP